MSLFIKNVYTLKTLLGENSEDKVDICVGIEAGKINYIGKEDLSSKYEKSIDGQGNFLAPGLCDPQVHFREPGLEYKEDIESGSRAANKGGFTTVISMPNTTPTADNFETVKYMFDKQKEIGLCRVLPTGAVTMGLAGKDTPDYDGLKRAGAIALTDDGKGVQSDVIFEKALMAAAKLDLPVLDHSEDESLSLGGAIHKGAISEKYNIKGIDSNSEAVHVKRGCELSKKTGGHYHVLHISTAKSIEWVRAAKKDGVRVTAEVSPHHLILCDEDIPEKENGELDANFKMNPPLRSKEDRAACIEALKDGTIDAIATDHAPHAPYEKEMPIEKAPFGIIGLETAFPLIYTKFIQAGKLSLSRGVDLMSKDAAALFSLKQGRIKLEANADLAIFDLENEFVVDESFFASKSKNSPFIGEKLKGKTLFTIFDGKVVYEG